jgi:AraC family transcriptional regulator
LRVARASLYAHTSRVAVTAPISSVRAGGHTGRLSDVHCNAERADRPFAERHDGWTVALVRRGAFNYRAADTSRTHALRPGWLILGRSGMTYECSHDHDGGDDCLALQIAPDVIDEVASLTAGCRGAIFPMPVLGPVTRLAALMERLSAGTGDFDEEVYDLTSALLAHAHAALSVPVPAHGTHRARIDAALVQIERGCHSPLALADLATAAGLSPFHFLRVFRRVTGTTPHQYVVGARLRRAARLLVDTSHPVTEIAYEVGFEDLSNFVRTFHRVVGCSPSAFRVRVPKPQ